MKFLKGCEIENKKCNVSTQSFYEKRNDIMSQWNKKTNGNLKLMEEYSS